jgi:hypothetical protein
MLPNVVDSYVLNFQNEVQAFYSKMATGASDLNKGQIVALQKKMEAFSQLLARNPAPTPGLKASITKTAVIITNPNSSLLAKVATIVAAFTGDTSYTVPANFSLQPYGWDLNTGLQALVDDGKITEEEKNATLAAYNEVEPQVTAIFEGYPLIEASTSSTSPSTGSSGSGVGSGVSGEVVLAPTDPRNFNVPLNRFKNWIFTNVVAILEGNTASLDLADFADLQAYRPDLFEKMADLLVAFDEAVSSDA